MRIPYDSLTLRAVVSELQPRVEGGVIQHVAQPSPADLILSVRSHGATHALLLSCDASTPRAHLTVVKRPNPAKPPAFCMLCRKYLEGARIESVTQRDFDRVLDLVAQDREGTRYTLTAELMGKHSNVILVHESGRILDSIKHITQRVSRLREVLPGRPYVTPPAPVGREDPFHTDAATLAALGGELPSDQEAAASRLLRHFQGLSPFLASEIAIRAAARPLPDVWNAIFATASRNEWSPVVVRNARSEPVGAYPFPSVQFPTEAQNARSSINTALDHYYSVSLPRAAADAARHQLTIEIDRALSSKRKQSDSVKRSLAETARADEFRENGELILASLHDIQPQAESLTVTDYYREGAPERTIPLDPTLTARENAEAWFRRYRKARDGAERLQEQGARLEEQIAALQSARGRVDDLTDLPEVQASRQELTTSLLLRPAGPTEAEQEKRRAEFDGRKIRRIVTIEGWEILVGENSDANDYLTGRVASPNDLWFHVRANASAHVIVRTRNQPQAVPQSVLRQAAELAARHSPAKHSSLVPVDYTLKKFVRKPRGSTSGAALYQNEKTLYVEPADQA